jgi:DNA repair protein RadC
MAAIMHDRGAARLGDKDRRSFERINTRCLLPCAETEITKRRVDGWRTLERSPTDLDVAAESTHHATSVPTRPNSHQLRDTTARVDAGGDRVSESVPVHEMTAQALRTNQLADRWSYLERLSEADALYTVEILELLLHFGRSSHRAPSLARQLFNRFGSLGGVLAADHVMLSEVLDGDDISVMLLKTVHIAVSAIIRERLEYRPVINSRSVLMEYLSTTTNHKATETMRVLYLDRKNALIRDEIQQRSTVDFTPTIVKRALELQACALILIHNSLVENAKSSRHYIQMTHSLVKALRTIKITLHDHIIISPNGKTSFRRQQLL